MIEVKPCPFCGGTPRFPSAEEFFNATTAMFPYCIDSCCGFIKNHFDLYQYSANKKARILNFSEVKDAIKSIIYEWNKRPYIDFCNVNISDFNCNAAFLSISKTLSDIQNNVLPKSFYVESIKKQKAGMVKGVNIFLKKVYLEDGDDLDFFEIKIR